MYDILICGAGPAGSNLARLLGNDPELAGKYSIGLIDKRRLDLDEDSLHTKACGGLLSPDAQKIMGQMGLTLPASILEDPQLFRVRTIDFDNQVESSFQRNYLNMNREKFDRYLFNLIPQNVDLYCGDVIQSIQSEKDYWHIILSSGKTIQAKFLVAADGANSFVRRQVCPTENHKARYISLQKWYPVDTYMPYYTGIFSKDITDYYSWTIQKGKFLVLGTAIPADATDVHQRFQRLENKISEHLGVTLGKSVKTEGAFIERTQLLQKMCFTKKILSDSGVRLNIAFIGEAAGATSPTSAEGFSYAFKTSLNLYQSMRKGFANADLRYQYACDGIRLNVLFKNLKSPGMYFPPLREFALRFFGDATVTPAFKQNEKSKKSFAHKKSPC